MSEPDRKTARRLAEESLSRGDAIGWFETLYDLAAGQASLVPWADQRVNPNLAGWLDREPACVAAGRRVLVVGCGLGDDAEEFAARGCQVTAFDVSPTAIAWCRRRYPNSDVDYVAADLLAPPDAWRGAFDLVVEIYTLQVLPAELRAHASQRLAEFVAPGGTLLVIARGRDPQDEPGAMPWPLLQSELETIATHGLSIAAREDYLDAEDPPVRRFRVEYRAHAR